MNNSDCHTERGGNEKVVTAELMGTQSHVDAKGRRELLATLVGNGCQTSAGNEGG